ncbi:SseB family protein [Streptomyces sp. GC420]|nr:SseB family protein [Streptomyces sp. GC420]
MRAREVLEDFRDSALLVPLDEHGHLWSAEFGGIRWIAAFSDEEALARFATARSEDDREWNYRKVLGRRLLDVVVPAVGGPCGVAIDAGNPDGRTFPPVMGVVPAAAALGAPTGTAKPGGRS